jgi:hypothetical protein
MKEAFFTINEGVEAFCLECIRTQATSPLHPGRHQLASPDFGVGAWLLIITHFSARVCLGWNLLQVSLLLFLVHQASNPAKHQLEVFNINVIFLLLYIQMGM